MEAKKIFLVYESCQGHNMSDPSKEILVKAFASKESADKFCAEQKGHVLYINPVEIED